MSIFRELINPISPLPFIFSDISSTDAEQLRERLNQVIERAESKPFGYVRESTVNKAQAIYHEIKKTRSIGTAAKDTIRLLLSLAVVPLLIISLVSVFLTIDALKLAARIISLPYLIFKDGIKNALNDTLKHTDRLLAYGLQTVAVVADVVLLATLFPKAIFDKVINAIQTRTSQTHTEDRTEEAGNLYTPSKTTDKTVADSVEKRKAVKPQAKEDSDDQPNLEPVKYSDSKGYKQA